MRCFQFIKKRNTSFHCISPFCFLFENCMKIHNGINDILIKIVANCVSTFKIRDKVIIIKVAWSHGHKQVTDQELTIVCYINKAFIYILNVGGENFSFRPEISVINVRIYLFMLKMNKRWKISFKKNFYR